MHACMHTYICACMQTYIHAYIKPTPILTCIHDAYIRHPATISLNAFNSVYYDHIRVRTHTCAHTTHALTKSFCAYISLHAHTFMHASMHIRTFVPLTNILLGSAHSPRLEARAVTLTLLPRLRPLRKTPTAMCRCAATHTLTHLIHPPSLTLSLAPSHPFSFTFSYVFSAFSLLSPPAICMGSSTQTCAQT